MNEMQVFSNLEFGSIRTIKVDGEPWFVLKDVREAFGETNYRRVAIRLEDDEKGVSQITTPGGKQNMTIHEVLTSRGIQSVMDRKPNGEEGRKCRE